MNENPGLDSLKNEQRQELFEAIRHFTKYKTMGFLNPALTMPKSGEIAEEALIKLYEEVYESPKTPGSE